MRRKKLKVVSVVCPFPINPKPHIEICCKFFLDLHDGFTSTRRCLHTSERISTTLYIFFSSQGGILAPLTHLDSDQFRSVSARSLTIRIYSIKKRNTVNIFLCKEERIITLFYRSVYNESSRCSRASILLSLRKSPEDKAFYITFTFLIIIYSYLLDKKRHSGWGFFFYFLSSSGTKLCEMFCT